MDFLFNCQKITEECIRPFFPPIQQDRDKYQTGYVVGWAGSPSMPGAALLASLGAFRGGAGIVRLLHPLGMESELACGPYELIKESYAFDQGEKIFFHLRQAGALFVGPGLGREEQLGQLLGVILPQLSNPFVLDADGLYFLAKSPFRLPPLSVLTPHLGELQRLLGRDRPLVRGPDLISMCQEYVERTKAILVLKGPQTLIFQANESVWVNTTGSPGLATAGSGDVLTGLISALMAQGLKPKEAALAGVYIHGKAGEIVAERRGIRGMMASDLLEIFPLLLARYQ